MFDIIFFNPPYYRGKAKNDFEAAFKGGDNFEIINRFISDSKNYLKKAGSIYMIISSDMGINTFKEIVNLYSYKSEIVTKINKFFETFYIFRLFN